MLRKRLSLALSFIVMSSCLVSASRYISGQANQQRKPIRVTVLRGKHQLKNKPTAQEIAFFKTQTDEDERKLEDEIPKHVPIKIKIRMEKEKEFKDLKNDKWVRDFELEVTNKADKPIYFLELWVVLPEVITENGIELGFPVRYGRSDFMKFKTQALPEDVAIHPGKQYVYKIADKYLIAWEKRWPSENRPPPQANPDQICAIKFWRRHRL